MVNIEKLNELADDYLYAVANVHEKSIYGDKLLAALWEMSDPEPKQTEKQTDEEYVVTLVRHGRFAVAASLLETVMGK
jgi:hypothetical protein